MTSRSPTTDAASRTRQGMSQRALLGGLGAICALAFLLSLLTGASGLDIGRALAALFVGGPDADGAVLIMREVRLPRALLGLMIGGALGLAGAALQGYLRNPLAEPGLIGVSAGATLGAVMVIHLGLAGLGALMLPIGGLAGALAAVLLVLGLSGLRAGPMTLILAGVAVTSFAGAMTSLVLNLSRNPFAATEIVFWMLGSLADRSLVHVALAAALMVPGVALLLTVGRALDALTLGEDTAASLGISLAATRTRVVAGTALAVGAATAVAGAISFVGLVIPHLLRPLAGHRPGRLLLPSFLGGATLVLLADVAIRIFRPDNELKLGVLTAIIGAPFFFWLVLRTDREAPP